MKAACLIFLLPLAGCHFHQDAQRIRVQQPTPGVRFTPTNDADVAFDGQTGQLCRTRPYRQGEEERETMCVTLLSSYPTK